MRCSPLPLLCASSIVPICKGMYSCKCPDSESMTKTYISYELVSCTLHSVVRHCIVLLTKVHILNNMAIIKIN